MRINIKNALSNNNNEKDKVGKDALLGLNESLVRIQKKFLAESQQYELLVANLRAWTKSHEQNDDIENVLTVAKEVRGTLKPEAFVTIGIGGSDLGARTLHACLNHSQHNLLSREDRGGAPEVYFTGDTFDPNELSDILDILEKRDLLLKSIYNVISKSGTTSETIAAFLVIKEKLEQKLKQINRDPAEYAQYVVATTGLNEKSALFALNQKQKIKFRALLPVPDGVGGRFSFASPVGLFFLALTANSNKESVDERIADALAGLKDAESLLYTDPTDDKNIAYRIASINYLSEKKNKGTVVFYPYSKTLKLLGDWYTQLSTESLQEKGQGQNVIATSGPTGNHSILNGIIGGPRDKLILFIRVEQYQDIKDFIIPSGSGLSGGLDVLEGKRFGFIQNASQLGTEINFTQNGVPNVTVIIDKISTYDVFKLMYSLEAVVAVEGELRELGRLTYEQSGVEGYKTETKKVLSKK